MPATQTSWGLPGLPWDCPELTRSGVGMALQAIGFVTTWQEGSGLSAQVEPHHPTVLAPHVDPGVGAGTWLVPRDDTRVRRPQHHDGPAHRPTHALILGVTWPCPFRVDGGGPPTHPSGQVVGGSGASPAHGSASILFRVASDALSFLRSSTADASLALVVAMMSRAAANSTSSL